MHAALWTMMAMAGSVETPVALAPFASDGRSGRGFQLQRATLVLDDVPAQPCPLGRDDGRYVGAVLESVRQDLQHDDVLRAGDGELVAEDVGPDGPLDAERGLLQPVLEELDAKLTGAPLSISLTEQGRVRGVDVVPHEVSRFENRRTRRTDAFLRMIVVRALAPLDLASPTGASRRPRPGSMDTPSFRRRAAAPSLPCRGHRPRWRRRWSPSTRPAAPSSPGLTARWAQSSAGPRTPWTPWVDKARHRLWLVAARRR